MMQKGAPVGEQRKASLVESVRQGDRYQRAAERTAKGRLGQAGGALGPSSSSGILEHEQLPRRPSISWSFPTVSRVKSPVGGGGGRSRSLDLQRFVDPEARVGHAVAREDLPFCPLSGCQSCEANNGPGSAW